MRRTQVLLDEKTYEALRRQAFQQRCSLSSLIRRLVARSLNAATAPRAKTIRDFRFVGAGRSRQARLAPVSERHDEALAEVLGRRHRG